MKFEEALAELKKGEQIYNSDWNGLKLKGKQMYLNAIPAIENELRTEPCIMMYDLNWVSLNGTPNGGWSSKRSPWTPSQEDMFSENWEIRKKIEADGTKN